MDSAGAGKFCVPWKLTKIDLEDFESDPEGNKVGGDVPGLTVGTNYRAALSSIPDFVSLTFIFARFHQRDLSRARRQIV